MNGHSHDRPDPALPWWSWACSTCHPDIYAVVTAVPRDAPRRPHECPFCMAVVPTFQNGRMRNHRDDARSCRGSGLPPAVADALFDLVIRGRRRGFDPMSLPPVEAGEDGPAEGDLAAVIVHLRQERLRSGMTMPELARLIGTPISVLAGWELGAGVRMDLLLTWAQELGMALHIGGDAVEDADGLSSLLKAMRIDQGFSLTQIRQNFGMKRETVANWERGGAIRGRSQALCHYCVLLGRPITLKPL